VKIVLVLHKYGVRLDDPCCFPLGFMYISAVLKQAGHDVTVLNQNISDFNINSINADAVLFTGFEEFKNPIIHDAAIFRGKGIKTILGGALATFQPQEMLNHLDTVIVGEGEEAICQALYSSGIIHGAKPNLDELPLPDYEGFGVGEYHIRNGIKHIGVLTSRGCPWSCRFCAQTCNFQYRDIGKVFEEIDFYREKYSPDLLVFNDNTLNIAKSRFMEICSKMEERKLPWTAAIRVSGFDEEMAIAAKNGGCKHFVVGVESFKQSKLDEMNKRIKVNEIYQALDLLHKHKIGYHGNVLTGLPNETSEDILDEIMNIPSGYNIHPVLVQPFIGTQYQTRSISLEHEKLFSDTYRSMIEERGMFQYPEVANG
jgi:anaerobic magnesium-protoporphyrin IX monomethyl ester cyclase